jgi:hypothetical protein
MAQTYEQPPRIRGEMYIEGDKNMIQDSIAFDVEMSMFKAQKGPPPLPLALDVRGEPMVAQYHSWYRRVGSSLAQKWYQAHPQPQKAKAKPAPPAAPEAPAAPAAPKRVMEAACASSGW